MEINSEERIVIHYALYQEKIIIYHDSLSKIQINSGALPAKTITWIPPPPLGTLCHLFNSWNSDIHIDGETVEVVVMEKITWGISNQSQPTFTQPELQ
jgi:hypothetical protein